MASPSSSVEIKYNQLFINNEFVDAVSGKTFATINPSTGEKICGVAEGDKADVDRAVVAAQAAFAADSPWRKLSAAQRGQLLFNLANLIERDQEYLAKLESLDAGKLHFDTKVIDLPSTVEHLRYYAGYADKIYGKTMPTENDFFTYTRKEPIGICAAILPWNFPLVLLTWKVGPALATGNCIIVKPSENTPLTTLYFASLVKEAGFPAGVFQVIPGFGSGAGAALAQHMDIRKVSFTGSTKVGKLIQKYAADSNLKRVSLELGGKSPNIILEDADLNYAVHWSAMAVFFNTGQCCTAGSRTFVHESIYDEFVKRSVEHAKSVHPGDPFDPNSKVGPVVNEFQMKRVLEMIESGKSDGAKLMCGGTRLGQSGYFIQPTVFADVTDNMRVAKEEIFGPVQQILKFHDLSEVIERANQTSYGLAAGVFTRDINKALKIAHGLHAGTVWVNCYNIIKPQMPFGGYKESGIGREMSEDVFNEYTETKSVMVKIC